jgi:hypothetical protein
LLTFLVEILGLKINRHAGQKKRYIATNQNSSRAGVELPIWIVIPVVVGSSPISHPSIHAGLRPLA